MSCPVRPIRPASHPSCLARPPSCSCSCRAHRRLHVPAARAALRSRVVRAHDQYQSRAPTRGEPETRIMHSAQRWTGPATRFTINERRCTVVVIPSDEGDEDTRAMAGTGRVLRGVVGGLRASAVLPELHSARSRVSRASQGLREAAAWMPSGCE